MTIMLFPGPDDVPGDAKRLTFHESALYRTAAGRARRIYPGPIGELVFRELSAYVEFGYRLGNEGLIPRLADAVLAADANPPDISA